MQNFGTVRHNKKSGSKTAAAPKATKTPKKR